MFSVTVLVLQLASGQFSPRVLRTFLRDQRNQVTLGVFLATFLLALIVLRAVRGEEGQADQFVTGASIAVSFVLVASVGLFVQCIHNIANSIRVIEIIDRIATETDEAIDRVHPEEETSPPALQTSAATRTVAPDRRRVVTGVNLARLASVAERAGLVLVVIPRPGAFVAHGMPIVAVHGDGDIDQHQVRDAVILDKERDLAEDPAFGFRQLVDIAEPALSPGTNDPTTAAQCLDHLNDLLRSLACRPLLPHVTAGEDGTVRAVAPKPGWKDYVSLSSSASGTSWVPGWATWQRLSTRRSSADAHDPVPPSRSFVGGPAVVGDKPGGAACGGDVRLQAGGSSMSVAAPAASPARAKGSAR